MPNALSANAFVRFVNLMRALSVLPAGVVLDAHEERLMQELARRWGSAQPVTVLEAMHLLDSASPSTVQRRIRTLEAKGLLALEPCAHDARVRHLVPTAQGKAYFDRLGDLMRQAVSGG